MLKEYLLVCYKNDLGTIINQPLHTTQRIKFTSFNVSQTYIIFGATSGGIYIYKRKPCTFLKLLPSKEGAISNVAISPDEKILAISTSKGLVLILINPFHNKHGDFLVFTEHENNQITAMKWYQNYLYTGDHLGNVAVIDVDTSFAKSIFKVPSASLMLLDSPIVQLDTYSKYLLMSTETKTFLCDTLEEHYKQIGKKLRSGNFGCCFLSNYINSDLDSIENVKIISARPGCRLWEADFTCQVVRTHQFKETLSESVSLALTISEKTDDEIEISSKSITLSEFNNFKLLHVIDNNFILTFNKKGLYIFDLKSVSVLYWKCDFDNIKDVKICKNYIYIWTELSNVILVCLTKLDKILKKALSNKQFHICSKLCLYFKSDILELLKNSDELHLILMLKGYLSDKTDLETINELSSLFDKIETDKKAKSCVLENGIHVITNLKAIGLESNESIQVNGHIKKLANEQESDIMADPLKDINYKLNILYKYYKINNNLDMKSIHKTFETKDLIDIIEILNKFVINVVEIELLEYNEIPQLWCYIQFLYYIQEKNYDINEFDATVMLYTIQAFKTINTNNAIKCTCSYPLPIIRKHKPKYYEIGCAIVKSIYQKEDCLTNFIADVPYMWKYLLELQKYEDLNFILPIIIQFSDEEVLNYFVDRFTYDIWDYAVRLLIKLKKKICLNCEKTVNCEDCSIDWTKFGIIMMENIGSIGAIKILTRYVNDIKSNELGIEFYQSCIFGTIINNYKNGSLKTASDFLKNMHTAKNSSNEVSGLLNKYLTKRYLSSIETTEVDPINTVAPMNCTYCDLPLKCPVLKEVTNLNCGHSYHNICILHLNKICTLCTRLK